MIMNCGVVSIFAGLSWHHQYHQFAQGSVLEGTRRTGHMALGSSASLINQLTPRYVLPHIRNIAQINLDHLSSDQICLYVTDPSDSPASLANRRCHSRNYYSRYAFRELWYI
jgi:hypothetical protein